MPSITIRDFEIGDRVECGDAKHDTDDTGTIEAFDEERRQYRVRWDRAKETMFEFARDLRPLGGGKAISRAVFIFSDGSTMAVPAPTGDVRDVVRSRTPKKPDRREGDRRATKRRVDDKRKARLRK